MRWVSILTILLSHCLVCRFCPADEQSDRFYIDLYDGKYQTRNFSSDSHIHITSHRTPSAETSKPITIDDEFKIRLPVKKLRESVFDRVPGLQSLISKWDDVDRDLLWVKALSKDRDALRAAYPGIPGPILDDLQNKIRATVAKESP